MAASWYRTLLWSRRRHLECLSLLPDFTCKRVSTFTCQGDGYPPAYLLDRCRGTCHVKVKQTEAHEIPPPRFEPPPHLHTPTFPPKSRTTTIHSHSLPTTTHHTRTRQVSPLSCPLTLVSTPLTVLAHQIRKDIRQKRCLPPPSRPPPRPSRSSPAPPRSPSSPRRRSASSRPPGSASRPRRRSTWRSSRSPPTSTPSRPPPTPGAPSRRSWLRLPRRPPRAPRVTVCTKSFFHFFFPRVLIR
jgi:hypothetical protein